MYKYFVSLCIRMLENMDQKNSGFDTFHTVMPYNHPNVKWLWGLMLTLYVGPHVDHLTHLLLDTWKKNKVIPSPIITPSISNTFVFISNISIYVGPKF